MISAQAALWGKAAAATLADLVRGAHSLAGAAARRTAAASGIAAAWLRTTFQGSRNNFAARAAAFRTAVTEQRHGTWLILFVLLFSMLWLGAGWIGMPNGLWRGLVVGIATPFAVNALFPLKRR